MAKRLLSMFDEAIDLSALVGKAGSIRRHKAVEDDTGFDVIKPLKRLRSLELQAAQAALMMIVKGRWYEHFVERNQLHDPDLLRLVGLTLDESGDYGITVAQIRYQLVKQQQRLARRQVKGAAVLDGNVRLLGDAFKLDATQRAVLKLAAIVSQSRYFSELFRRTVSSTEDVCRAVSHATQRPIAGVRKALAAYSPLRRAGLLSWYNADVSNQGAILAMQDTLAAELLAPGFSLDLLVSRLAPVAPPATLSLQDFNYVAEGELLQRYLSRSSRTRLRGVNILIHGRPGTGKTEFARTVAAAIGCRLHEVPHQDEEGNPCSSWERLTAFVTSQQLLGMHCNQLLLFDEVEDVLAGYGSSDLFSLRSINRQGTLKCFMNEALESNRVPTVWICNAIDSIDPAHLRRFDMIVPFSVPDRATRHRILQGHFADTALPEDCISRLADNPRLAPGLAARAARVLNTARLKDEKTRVDSVEKLVCNSLLAQGERPLDRHVSRYDQYDLTLLNPDRDLAPIAAGLQRMTAARLCLSGPPGTGKTGFAHHLSRSLQRPLSVKNASDLLGMFVGQTERNIAEAFALAKLEGAILLFDEIDGMLADRDGSRHRWEVTEVNELLAQMEGFDGVFIATTNRLDALDAAALRRFDFKVRFDFLRPEQRRRLLRHHVAQAALPINVSAWRQLDQLAHLTPADFTGVARQFALVDEQPSPDEFVQRLVNEVSFKREASAPRPMGFLASHG